MTAAARVGALILSTSVPDHPGTDLGGALARVLVERFGARVVAIQDRQLASPEHARHAISAGVRNLSGVDVVVLVVSGQIWQFQRRAGDVVALALPGSIPGRPGSTLPLSVLFDATRPRREHSMVLCADLAGVVPLARVAEAFPGTSVLLTVGAATGSACQEAFAEVLAATQAARELADILRQAAQQAGRDRPVLLRHVDQPVTVMPTNPAASLPSYIIEDLTAADPGSRLDAVSELAALADSDPVAVTYLHRIAAEDRDRAVRDFASRRLQRPDRPWLPALVRDGVIPAELVTEVAALPDLPELLDQPGGPAVIGVDAPEGDASCRPRHRVDLAPHTLSRTVVTNRQYLAFVAATGHPCPDHWATGTDLRTAADLPVVMVSWLDASRYCQWLAGNLGASWRVRLPSEVEWEAAAGNGSGDPYPWGRAWQPMAANTRAAGLGAVVATGRQFPAGVNATGCHDLIGNVWEWTRSRWGSSGRMPTFGYPYRPDDGREIEAAPDRPMRFVVRGGAYYYATECANSYTRNRMYATDRHPAGGFRVAATRRKGDTA